MHRNENYSQTKKQENIPSAYRDISHRQNRSVVDSRNIILDYEGSIQMIQKKQTVFSSIFRRRACILTSLASGSALQV